MTNPSEAMIEEAVILFRAFCRGLERRPDRPWTEDSSEQAIAMFRASMQQAVTPAAPVPDDDAERFFIDHGMIHDRVSGRHVTCEPTEWAFGSLDINETCALLNSLARLTPAPLVEALREQTALVHRLCNAVDLAAEDIGHESIDDLLALIGPANERALKTLRDGGFDA